MRTQTNTKKICVLAMVAALAFILATVMRFQVFPLVHFLRYDPKDVVLVIGGFIYGPLAIIPVISGVAVLEFFGGSVNRTIFSVFSNIVASVSFCCTAAAVYRRNRTFQGAVVGLLLAVVMGTSVMMLWNYTLVPIFTPFVTREYVASIMLGGFLPFNLFKNTLNAALAMLLYRHMKSALQSVDLLPVDRNPKGRSRWVVTALIVSGVLAASGVIALFLFNRLWFSGA